MKLFEAVGDWRERNYLWAHWLWCSLVVGGTALADWRLDSFSITNARVDSGVLSAAAGVFGALLGFAITTLAIVLGYAGDDRLKKVRESADHWRLLWKTLFAGTRVLAIATVIGLFGPIVFPTKNILIDSAFLYVFLFFSMLSILRTARVIWILRAVTEIVAGVSFHKTTVSDVLSVLDA